MGFEINKPSEHGAFTPETFGPDDTNLQLAGTAVFDRPTANELAVQGGDQGIPNPLGDDDHNFVFEPTYEALQYNQTVRPENRVLQQEAELSVSENGIDTQLDLTIERRPNSDWVNLSGTSETVIPPHPQHGEVVKHTVRDDIMVDTPPVLNPSGGISTPKGGVNFGGGGQLPQDSGPARIDPTPGNRSSRDISEDVMVPEGAEEFVFQRNITAEYENGHSSQSSITVESNNLDPAQSYTTIESEDLDR